MDDPILPKSGFSAQHNPVQPELTLVSDVREWMFYKKQYKLTTPTNTHMFATSDAAPASTATVGVDERGFAITNVIGQAPGSPVRAQPVTQSSLDDVKYIVLEAHEIAYIPFKFQSFCCGAVDVSRPASSRLCTVSLRERVLMHNLFLVCMTMCACLQEASEKQLGALLAFPAAPRTKLQPYYQPIRHRIVQINVENIERHALAYMRVSAMIQRLFFYLCCELVFTAATACLMRPRIDCCRLMFVRRNSWWTRHSAITTGRMKS